MKTIISLWNYIKSLYETAPRTRPEKIWCFYRDPYRKGLATTGLAFGGTVLLTIIVFIIIGLIALGLFLISGALYLGSALGALFLTFRAYSAMAASSKNDDNRGAAFGALIVGVILFSAVKFIFGIAQRIWEFSERFSENLNYASVAAHLLVANALNIFLFIIFPMVAVLTVAGITIGIN